MSSILMLYQRVKPSTNLPDLGPPPNVVDAHTRHVFGSNPSEVKDEDHPVDLSDLRLAEICTNYHATADLIAETVLLWVRYT